MIYLKKPLFIFSIVILSTIAVASFFIRKKILNDWKITELNFLLKQISDLETEIQKDEKDLEINKKLQISIEEKNKDIEQNIEKLGKFISNYDVQIKELKSRHTLWKKAKDIENISDKYKEIQKKIKNISKETESSNLKKLSISYYQIISNYIDFRKNISHQIDKYLLSKEKDIKQKINLNEEINKNKNLLSNLKIEINKLTENLNDQKSKLMSLKNFRKKEKERERKKERERERDN